MTLENKESGSENPPETSQPEVAGVTAADNEDDNEITVEAELSQIRNAVRDNKIKLWVDPYFDPEVGCNDDQVLELAGNLAPTLLMDVMAVFAGLKVLQSTALERLKARSNFSQSGQMTFTLKLTKAFKKGNEKQLQVTVDANLNGDYLAKEIATLIGGDHASLKLICSGRTIDESQSLASQNIAPGSTIMVVKINKDDRSWSVAQEQKQLLDVTKEDIETLGASDDLQITNQDGAPVDLPKGEQKALILAMSYHEKGRAAMKAGDFDLALVFLLEADVQYKACRADILKVVDNFGLLNLDIAWCYLKTGNISELPDGEQRLAACEKSFANSYGENLERLNTVRGSTQKEMVLLLRLRLLKSIVAFHNGHRQRAVDLMVTAERDVGRLDVPEDLVDEVEAQGFSRHEARLALRSVGNVVPAAVRFAQEVREKKEKLAKEEAERQKKRKRLGKTANGNWVNLGYLKTITEQGYEEKLAAVALRQTNNDIDAACVALEDDIATLVSILENEDVTPEKINFVAENGFSEQETVRALEDCLGNVEEAIERLHRDRNDPVPGTSNESKRQKRDEARERMVDALPENDDEYLDISLDDEKKLIEKYKKFLGL